MVMSKLQPIYMHIGTIKVECREFWFYMLRPLPIFVDFFINIFKNSKFLRMSSISWPYLNWHEVKTTVQSIIVVNSVTRQKISKPARGLSRTVEEMLRGQNFCSSFYVTFEKFPCNEKSLKVWIQIFREIRHI